MPNEKYEISPVSSAELNEVSDFIAIENKNESMSSSYLSWWYFQNPFKTWSFFKIKLNTNICGISTTNNFIFNYNGSPIKVAMPQKVLTAKDMRGKGLFSKAYFASEEHNISEGVDFFLTFTNAASTPIFINKFKYSKGIAPKLYLIPSSPIHFLCSCRISIVDDFNKSFFSDKLIDAKNSILKNLKYFQWRYLTYNPNQYIILELKSNDRINGYAVLKKRTTKGLKFALLMDIILNDSSQISAIIKETRLWASKNYFLGIMALENELYGKAIKSYFKINTRKKFNFLVKGTEVHRQKTLEAEKFNFFLGDLDFL